jgi:hypothetical protein
MSGDEIPTLLIGSRIGFQIGVAALGRSDLSSSQRVGLCLEMAERLESANLSDAERGERYLRILTEAKLGVPELTALARALASAAPSIKNAASQALPDGLRPLLYGSAVLVTQRASVPPSDVQPEAAPEGKTGLQSGERRVLDTVVLLAADDQAANLGLLEKSGLGKIKFGTLGAFQDFVRSDLDVCACLFDGSFLGGLSREQQREAIEAVFRFSNFIWIRIHRGGLDFSEGELVALHKRVCCDPRGPTVSRLSFSDTGSMSESEVRSILEARDSLQVRRRGRITPGELSANEATILMAAVSKSILSTTLNASLEVTSLTTKFIAGGRTSAKVAQVRVNNGEFPLVAKIDSKENVIDEATRFLTFIGPADQDLRPETYFHQSTGVIIFGLVSLGGDDVVAPAPTLEENLSKLWAADIYEVGGDPAALEDDAKKAINSAIAKIKRIGTSAMSAGFDTLAKPIMKPFEDAESRGRSWGLSRDAVKARKRAETRFSVLASTVPVHGDIHLRNILVRAGREAYLIDYACSGPGHPAIDLVRLELALFLSAFKQTADAATCQQLQRSLADPNTTGADLIERFETLGQWAVNRVCMHGMTEARNAALRVLKANGGNESDYYAAKYLVAWQALLVGGLQTGLAAAVIASLVDLIP